MTNKNKNTVEYLTQYYRSKSPNYAILISGKWGSGKTWLVKSSLKAAPDTKSVYVSLYGIREPRQIDDEIFRQLHPLLGSKGMRLAGTAIRSMMRLGLKMDLAADGHHGSVTSTVPEISLPEYLNNTKDRVLIFDDLERASMAVVDILGYINHFVEHQDHKVVIIANEEELETSSNEAKYRAIKEKLIGRTLEVVPDLEDAVSAFCEELTSTSARAVVEAQLDLISKLHAASGFKNLRHVRHALHDFDRLIGALEPKYREHPQIPTELLAMVLAISFETRSGELRAEQIADLENARMRALWKDGSKEDTAISGFDAKYRALLPSDSLIGDVTWSRIFATGLFPEGDINLAIRASRHFACEPKAPWIQLWHAMELDDSHFDELTTSFVSKLRDCELDSPEELAHVFGTLLTLSNENLIEMKPISLLDAARKNVDKLAESKAFLDHEMKLKQIVEGRSSSGLGFQGRDTPEFVEFRRHVERRLNDALEASYPEVAGRLIGLMTSDCREFVRELTLTNSSNGKFLEIPVLQHIAAGDFVSRLLILPPQALATVAGMFRERYKYDTFIAALMPEEAWLREVGGKLEALASERKKLSGFYLGLVAANMLAGAKTLAGAKSAAPTQHGG